MEDLPLKCDICQEFFLSLEEMNYHLQRNHALINEIRRFQCDNLNCNASFNNKSSLRSHKSRNHRNRLPIQNVERNIVELHGNMNVDEENNIENLQRRNVNPEPNDDMEVEVEPNDEVNISENLRDDDVNSDHFSGESDSEYSSTDSEEEEELDSDDTDEEDNEEPENLNPRKRAIGLLLLQLRTETTISEEKIGIILETMQNAVKEFVTHSLQQVENVIEDQENVQLGAIFNIEEHVRNINFVNDFNNKQKRSKYFQKEFNVLMPKKCILGRRFVKCGSTRINQERPMKIKTDEMYFVPLSKVLKNFSQNPTFPDILDNHTPKDGVFISFKDGLKFQRQVWRHDNSHNSILLYMDDVDMCDGLGSKSAGKQKLLMIYASNLEVHSMFRSSLLHIHLIAIVRSRDVKRYGLNTVLKPIVKDFKKMENGINYADGTLITSSLFATAGDNLSQNSACNLKESFGKTRHPCRFCLADLTQIRKIVEEDKSLLRTKEEHDRQVESIENAAGQEKEKLMMQYGIKGRSILNECYEHHITEGAPPDLVHDLILGVLTRTLQNFLQNAILTKITVEELNRRIASFDYGYSEVDQRPPTLKATHLVPGAGIKLSAVEMWLLGCMLPFIIQDLLEENCPYFENYINLLEIMSIVFGYQISHGMIDALADLIAEYLDTYTQLYGANSLIPKQHFMTHYPRLIEFFGPLYTFMCLRFEAKHQFFKRITQGMRNYKNLPLTLSVRHQQRQALELLKPLIKEVKFGQEKFVINYNLPFSQLFHAGELFCTTSWVSVNSVKYIPGKCLLAVGYSNDDLPEFAVLMVVLKYNEGPVFICKAVQTICLNKRLMAYEISIQEDYKVFRPCDLKNHEVFHCHKLENKLFVIIKRCFGDLY